MICVKRMPWSNVRIFVKLASQRCQLLSVGSIQEASAGHRSGSFESDALASTSNARHMECLFATWLRDNNSVNGTWQNFFKGMVEQQIDSQPPLNQEATRDILPSIGTTSPTDAAIGAPVLGRRKAISSSALQSPLDTSEADFNSCVAQSQKEDIGVLSHSTNIRTCGIYDKPELPTLPKERILKGCSMDGSNTCSKAHTSILMGNEMAHNISKNLNRKMSRKNTPEKPENPHKHEEILTGSRRTGNSRNNFQKKYGSFEIFMKFWKHAHALDKYKRHIGPVMVVKKRSKTNSKPINVMYFKNYFEKGLRLRKERLNKSKTNKEIQLPSKCPKEPGAKETIETSSIPQSHPETKQSTHVPRHKSDTYETLEELINDIDDIALNEQLSESIEPEKPKKGSTTPKLLENTPKKMPKNFKTALRVFKPEEKVIPKSDNNIKPNPVSKSDKTKLSKPKTEKYIPLRVFNTPKADEDKSWIYWDELAVKSLRKPTQD
ncbi:uncharacterized protein LOC6739601 [Drosophila simulans]|uniref:2-oxoglutarate dehydrogenase E1 component N-terminal domain-containing protein n=2 Tax=Drosophila simulans TaxID=7240 RepID=A0A0J9UC78_DROSI|nr:uncharacterized protein LOC6739601 [Drosophila simulans]KMY96880.1 uncharacterized protein Dsimw501_GD17619 [Drosophila simulans]